jgi:ubiquinone/menaquinone biosynthesis C-methylase UbiE
MTTEAASGDAHRSSTGQVLTEAEWLDAHYEAARAEYDAMLRSVPVQQGWRVLDAGCGSGSYLPLLAELVGSAGRVYALDHAPENIALVERRLRSERLSVPLVACAGSVTALPYPDRSFDMVWCANVGQYLSDADFRTALTEFRRVVRPGGLVAVKDVDMQLWRVYPGSPLLVSHLSDVSLSRTSTDPQSHGSLRGRELRRWLEQAGLAEVWQRTTLIERWSPLRAVERHFWADWLGFLARAAIERGVPAADQEIWRTCLDPAASDHLVDRPDFYGCEGQVVAVGHVPDEND